MTGYPETQGQKVEGNESDNYVPEPEPEEIEPEYHYSARGEEIKAEDEVAAVKAEVGNVEKETVVKAEPAAQVVEIVDKMPEPEIANPWWNPNYRRWVNYHPENKRLSRSA